MSDISNRVTVLMTRRESAEQAAQANVELALMQAKAEALDWLERHDYEAQKAGIVISHPYHGTLLEAVQQAMAKEKAK